MTGTFAYYAYDFKTGLPIGQVPLQNSKFGSQLNSPQQLTGSINLMDKKVRKTNPLASTIPNKCIIVVDLGGAVVGNGIVLPRVWNGPNKHLEIQGSESWSYFGQRVQATDYSAPPYSGVSGLEPMSLWKATPWDASLIACQVIEDAIKVPYGNPLGGLGVLLNGEEPMGSKPVSPESDYIAITYPYTSLQTIDTIVNQLSQLGLGVGFDFGLDIAYSQGPGSPLVGTVNISYPRRGRIFAENNLTIDLTTARGEPPYSFSEDGSQTANQVYEIGGSGAIVVDQNVNPLEQGYLLWERVFSRANMQSAHITSLLSQLGTSDLATYSYAPVAATVTLSPFDPNLPLGSFIVGDNVMVVLPELADDGEVFDPRFPAGLEQEWRIIGFTVEPKDKGDPVMTINLAQPPYLEALIPAV